MHFTPTWLLALMLTMALGMSGCGTTQPAKFYLLTASSNAQQASSAAINIGLGPIEFPAYLDRSKIIIRTSANSFETVEYHRWAEPLETNFSRVLSQELSSALPNAIVTTYPWRNGKEIKLQALIEVLSFDSDTSNQARLKVRWELLDANKKTLAPPQQREYIKTARNGDYEARVQAMSECVTALGQALAQEITRITPQ
jgi:hypothetical protein